MILPFAYLISYLVQKYFLKKIYFKKSSKKTLLVIFFLLILFEILLLIHQIYYYIINEKDKPKGGSFPSITFIMIIISDFLMIVIINLFIGLLPNNKFKFLCFKQSNIIIIIDKSSRLIPGIFFMIISILKIDTGIIFITSFELFLNILCFIFCFCSGHLLKSHSLTRIAYDNDN